MNQQTAMAATAATKLANQLGKALFGAPGLSLMEIANRCGEIEGIAKDVARYRWLRNDAAYRNDYNPAVMDGDPTDHRNFLFTESLDEAIDEQIAAMKEQAKGALLEREVADGDRLPAMIENGKAAPNG